jgi:hypothetical protein
MRVIKEKTGNAISGSSNGRRNWITNWFNEIKHEKKCRNIRHF